MKKRDFARKVGSFVLYVLGVPQRQLKAERKLLGGNYVRVVNFHDVQGHEVSLFERQIRFLGRWFSFISLEDFRRYSRGEKTFAKPAMLLTFDDGLAGCYRHLLPILKKRSLPAVFFVCPDKIGEPGYMSEKEIKEALDSGLVEIGSHTCSHCPMHDGYSDAKYTYEVIESKSRLSKQFGLSVDTFCWPFGENDCYAAKAFEAYLKADYSYGFCTFSEPVVFGKTNFDCIPRTNIQLTWSLFEVAYQLSPKHDAKFSERKAICLENLGKAKKRFPQRMNCNGSRLFNRSQG